ncbi:alpha/beta-hydrolase, partial [Myriangium duriaei CBS 260.36]
LPKVTLPWGTWQANTLDSQGQFYTFENIRFGASPSRFQASRYPDKISDPSTLQDNTYGPTCYQVDTHPKCKAPKPTISAAEDCLFLDIYVPKAVFERGQKGVANAPVVVWFYGGAFQFGAKSNFGPGLPFYTGEGLIDATKNFGKDVIFVAGNYRLGAFGWLAGPTIEEIATPNAGLTDQRLVLQWVQDYVSLFGGDKGNVAAWGESAGGSSILHHLIQDDGKRDPLFKRALMQSPAFQWQWDRSPGGTLDQIYQNFSKSAGCSTNFNDLSCLLKADVSDLAKANQELFDSARLVGLFPVGPALDNTLIKHLPAIALAKGLFWKNLDSLIVSHTTNEAKSFTPDITTPKQFDDFLAEFIREDDLANVRAAIQAQYPVSGGPWGSDQKQRVAAVIRDAIFVCNTRQLFDAYSGSVSTYMMEYGFPTQGSAVHASDLVPTFWNRAFDLSSFFVKFLCQDKDLAWIASSMMKQLAPFYQRFLAGFSINGNPNLF